MSTNRQKRQKLSIENEQAPAKPMESSHSESEDDEGGQDAEDNESVEETTFAGLVSLSLGRSLAECC
jgi:hypothetical protein